MFHEKSTHSRTKITVLYSVRDSPKVVITPLLVSDSVSYRTGRSDYGQDCLGGSQCDRCVE